MQEREYRRIQIPELRAHFNTVPSEASSPVLISPESSRLPPLREDGSDDAAFQNAIISHLLRLEAKVDRLIGYLEKEKHGISYSYHGEVLDIGGGGLSLKVDREHAAGTILDLCIFPRFGDPKPIFAIGKVCWVRQCAEANGQSWSVLGVEFSDISEDDRRAIVRMVFQTERKQRRDRLGAEQW